MGSNFLLEFTFYNVHICVFIAYSKIINKKKVDYIVIMLFVIIIYYIYCDVLSYLMANARNTPVEVNQKNHLNENILHTTATTTQSINNDSFVSELQ